MTGYRTHVFCEKFFKTPYWPEALLTWPLFYTLFFKTHYWPDLSSTRCSSRHITDLTCLLQAVLQNMLWNSPAFYKLFFKICYTTDLSSTRCSSRHITDLTCLLHAVLQDTLLTWPVFYMLFFKTCYGTHLSSASSFSISAAVSSASPSSSWGKNHWLELSSSEMGG